MQLQITNNPHSASPAHSFRSARYRVRSNSCLKDANPIRQHPRTANIQLASVKCQSITPIASTALTQRGTSASGTLRVQRNLVYRQESLHQLASRTPSEWASSEPLFELKQNLPKPSYNDTVEMLVKLKQQVRADSRDWRGRSRISLPFVEEVDPESHFIAMDPIRIQIDYVQKCIDEANAELQQNRAAVKEVTLQLRAIPPIVDKKLADIIAEMEKHKGRFKDMLKVDSIHHQQSVVNAREDSVELRKGLVELGESFDHTLIRTQDIQQVVFRSLPYELVENVMECQPFDQHLF